MEKGGGGAGPGSSAYHQELKNVTDSAVAMAAAAPEGLGPIALLSGTAQRNTEAQSRA